jgi:hypothetical protein
MIVNDRLIIEMIDTTKATVFNRKPAEEALRAAKTAVDFLKVTERMTETGGKCHG